MDFAILTDELVMEDGSDPEVKGLEDYYDNISGRDICHFIEKNFC